MSSINYTQLAKQVRDALRASFSELIAANPDRTFYAFAIWTDGSLQFAYPAASTEEGLSATAERYMKQYGKNYTVHEMRWYDGDWEFFPAGGEDHFAEINQLLRENFSADETIFVSKLEPLWKALLEGFQMLEKEGFFGTGKEREKITLLLAGNLEEELIQQWATALNPLSVAQRYINWYDGNNS